MIITDVTKMARRACSNIFGNIVVRSKIIEFVLLWIEKYFYAGRNGQYYAYYIKECIWILYKMIKYNSDLVLFIVRNKKFKSLLDIALPDRSHVDFDMNIRISAHSILKFIQTSDMKSINVISLRGRSNDPVGAVKYYVIKKWAFFRPPLSVNNRKHLDYPFLKCHMNFTFNLYDNMPFEKIFLRASRACIH